MDTKIQKKLDDFFSQHKHQSYKKREILIRADDNPRGVFYLKNGYVKQYAISKKGDALVVNVFKPLSFFPMSWAINNTPNAYFFEAMTDVEAYRAPKEKVIEFINSNPDVLFDLMKRVYKGTDGILYRMTYLMTGSALNRVIVEILINAMRFGKKYKDSVKIKISESDLANEVGTTRETVSRELKILKEKKLLTYKKGEIIIKSLHQLEDLLF